MNTQLHPMMFNRMSILHFFSTSEMRELNKMLMPDEQAVGALSGFHARGTATLCITTHRLLLLDKKMLHFSYEDVRFEAISEVDFSEQLFLAYVVFHFAGRRLSFRSWYRKELRMLAQYVQTKMFDVRKMADVTHDGYGTMPIQGSLPAAESIASPVVQRAPLRYRGVASRVVNHPWSKSRFQRWQKASAFIRGLSLIQRANQVPYSGAIR